jgi:hypothetical protein
VALCSLAAQTTTGCGDDPAETGAGGQGGEGAQGGGAIGGSGGQGGHLDVGDGELSVVAKFWSPEGKIPTEGVSLTLQGPGNMTQEIKSDAAGRATFTGLLWSAGTASVTAYTEGWHLLSVVGITETNEDVEVLLGSPDSATTEMVTVSGTASGMVDETHGLLLSPANGGGFSAAIGPDYALSMVAGQQTDLIAAEADGWWDGQTLIQQLWWSVMQVGPFDNDTLYDADLAANAVTPVSVAGSFVLPSREESPLRTGRPDIQVSGNPNFSTSYVGMATSIQLSSDGASFEFTSEHVELASVTHPLTVFGVYVGDANGEVPNWFLQMALGTIEGYPQDGEVDPQLVDLPELIAPSGPGVHHPLFEPVEFQAFEQDLLVSLMIFRQGELIWRVEAQPGATELTVPPLPAAAPATYLLGTAQLWGRLTLARDEVPIVEGWWDHGAVVQFPVDR